MEMLLASVCWQVVKLHCGFDGWLDSLASGWRSHGHTPHTWAKSITANTPIHFWSLERYKFMSGAISVWTMHMRVFVLLGQSCCYNWYKQVVYLNRSVLKSVESFSRQQPKSLGSENAAAVSRESIQCPKSCIICKTVVILGLIYQLWVKAVKYFIHIELKWGFIKCTYAGHKHEKHFSPWCHFF